MDIPTIVYVIVFCLVLVIFLCGLGIVCYQNHRKQRLEMKELYFSENLPFFNRSTNFA